MGDQCPACGSKRQDEEFACLNCGAFYSKLDELLAIEAAEQEQKSFKGRIRRILSSEQKFTELFKELNVLKNSLPLQSWFAIFVIFCFVFALIIIVL